MDTTANSQHKSNKKAFVFLGIALGLAGLTGLGYWYFNKDKGAKVDDPNKDLFNNLNEENSATPSAPKNPSSTTTAVNSGFPLKEKSKGALVKQLQEALIKKYGDAILPKYGADGSFGKEMIAALKSKDFPATVDELLFNKIVAESETSTVQTPVTTNTPKTPTGKTPLTITQAIDISKNIWNYADKRDMYNLLAELKRIRNVEDYKNVNELFKTIKLNGVRQTIVNGLLSTFSDASNKLLLSDEFKRIGLKKDVGGKWQLSGIANKIITNTSTTIHDGDGVEIEVPSETLLGLEIGRTPHYSSFRSFDNATYYVPTKHIRYV